MNENEILKIKELRKSGLSYAQIARKLSITKSQAAYYSKIDLDEYNKNLAAKRKYENYVCELAKKTRNFNQLCKVLGKRPTNETIRLLKNILEKNKVDYSHFISEPEKYNGFQRKKEISELLVNGKVVSVTHLKERLLNEGLKEYKCEKCGRTEWEGKKIPLQLHHINGDRTDNRLENLQVLCPNCHALTDNYCGKKMKKEKRYCPVCGKEICRGSKLCKDCFQKIFKEKRVDLIYDGNGELKKEILNVLKEYKKTESKLPTKNELIDAFKECGSFSGVGKKYGVSDKTISNWCVSFNLPSHSLEMRNYVKELYGEKIKWKFTEGNPQAFINYRKLLPKKICLLDENGGIKKIYSEYKEIANDGFRIDHVRLVCENKSNKHKGRSFKFYDDL